MKYYFLSILKRRTPIIIALTIIFLIVAVVINNVSSYIEMTFIEGVYCEVPRKGLFIVYIIGILLLSIIVTLIEFSFKMLRIQSQQAYSFPILREKLFLARYLVGLIEIVIPFVVAFFVSSLMVYTQDNLYNLKYLWLYLPCILASGILSYSYLSFMYCRANNIIDGIAGMLLSVLAPLSFGIAVEMFLNRFNIELIHGYYFTPLYVIDYLTSLMETLLVGEAIGISWIPLAFFSFWVVITGLTIGFMDYFNKRIKSEDIASDSNSLFTYQIFIGLATVSLTVILSFFISLWAPILCMGLTFGGYILYKRGIDFEEKNMQAIIISLSELVLGILLASFQWGGLL